MKGWEDPRPQAGLAQSAADQLSEARLTPEAVAAYERALELHRLSGDAPVAEVRVLRSLAWLAIREEVSATGVARARALMAEAAGILETPQGDAPESPELRSELAQTWHQLAQVLDRWVSVHVEEDDDEDEESGPAEALGEAELTALRLEEVLLWDRAAGVYTDLGGDHLAERFQCLNNAAWTERELGRPEAGAARLSALIEELRTWPEGSVPEWILPRAERTVAHLTD